MKFNYQDWKVVLWGHETTENTFHYIHKAYEKAFRHLGAKVFWLNDRSQVSNFDFSNTLFFTEGQVDKNIPLREDCLYLLHNCYDDKYKPFFEKNVCFRMQTYTDAALKYNLTKLDECILADYDGKCVYFPWATDLLPHEIEANKPSVAFNRDSKIVHWIGTVGDGVFGNIHQLTPFINACKSHGLTFTNQMNMTVEDNIRMIRESYMAPTIVGKWQHENGYIPCRIFKNISYGQFGITSSPRVYELFGQKIVHNNDSNQLFYDAKNKLESLDVAELHLLMDTVKLKHTYLNRIDTVINFINTLA